METKLKKKLLLTVACSLALAGCSYGTLILLLKPGPDAKKEKAVAYENTYIPTKTPNDRIYLQSGETVAFLPGYIAPPPEMPRPIIRAIDSGEMDLKSLATFDVIIDREQYVLCISTSCTRIVYICPPMEQLRRGVKCDTFLIRRK